MLKIFVLSIFEWPPKKGFTVIRGLFKDAVNIADSDEISYSGASDVALHCLPKHLFKLHV